MINAELLKELNSKINTLTTDFKAEVIALDLVKKGVDPQQIFIVPNGVIGKSSAKDVENIHLEHSIYTSKEYVYIISNRAGIYDTLPEGLFHEQYSYHQESGKTKIKKSRVEEKKARQFFLLFEAILNRYKIRTTYREYIGNYQSLASIIYPFTTNWSIFKLLDQRQSILFFYTIPIIHQIRNNYSLVADFLTLLLGVPIVISLKQKTISRKVYPKFSLNESRFGVSTVLGGVSSENIHVLNVSIGPVGEEEIGLFVTKSVNDLLLDEIFLWLFDCQIPIERNIISVNKPKERPAVYYLGVNTFFS